VKRLLFEDGGGIESAPVGGIGLGLYLAKKVIASAGGTLAYEKRKTGGCRFIVRLPKSK
jgi:K+-sensing histidine kinase KdpD